MLISVLKIVGNTAADGPGLRTSVYLAGCRHHCPGCHNPQSWNINNGTMMEVDNLVKEIESYGNQKVTITGGDPFYQWPSLVKLVNELKRREYNIWIYTGYTFEDLQKGMYTPTTCSNLFKFTNKFILSKIDGLVDGPFIQELRDTSLRFRGSSNQKIYLRDSQGILKEDLTQYC